MVPGDRIASRYRLIDRIGAGGMGEVWRAEQEKLGRAVAVKLIRRGEQAGARERFAREAELAAKVDHRNVVDIIDYGETDEGDQYLVMPLLRGETLAARLRRAPPPALGEVLAWVRGVLGGLAAIHDEGIVHRDLKPGNVFLAEDADGVVPKLLDFGISRAPRSAESGSLTQVGTAVGTPEYMAPEQFESARDVDHRADVYGAGAMLYEALAGRPPMEGPDAFAIYRKLLTSEPIGLAALRPELPSALVEVVDRALAKEPAGRFASARQMRDAIDALAASGALGASVLTSLAGAGTPPPGETLGTAATTPAERVVAPTLALGPVSATVALAPSGSPSAARGQRAREIVPDDALAERTRESSSGGVEATQAMPSGVEATAAMSASSPTIGTGDTVADAVPARARAQPPAPEPARRSSAAAIAIVAVLAASGVGAWVYLSDGESSEITPEPPPIASHDPSESPSAHTIAGPDRLSSLALAWARLPHADRAHEVRLVSAAGRWSLIAAPQVEEEDAQRLASALGQADIARADWGEGLRPALLRSNVRLNVHVEASVRSATREVIAHDTLVVGLYGTIDGAASRAEGEGAVTYFVVSAEQAGWALSRFLEPHEGCMPTVDALVDEGGQRTALPSETSFARTHVELLGPREPAFLVVARDRSAARTTVALHRAEGECALGAPLLSRRIDGVVDETFLTETARAGGQSLLLVSWHPRPTPPDDGVMEWAAYLPGEDEPLLRERLPTAPYLPRARGGSVSGTRDRILRAQREHLVLLVRRPGAPRVFYRWEDESLVPLAPTAEAPADDP